MALNKLYKEVEKEKENEIKNEVYTMPLKDFIEEHRKLVKILREGSREELLAEAEEQCKELKECLEEHGMSEEDEEEDD